MFNRIWSQLSEGDTMYFKLGLKHSRAALTLVLGVLSVMGVTPLIRATPPAPSTITPRPPAESVGQPCPASTLELVWQTGGTPDELLIGASWLMVDMEGNVYTVANAGKHAIKKFDADGKFAAGYGTFGKRDDQFASPVGMAIDTSGNIYVNDFQAARVLKFDPDWNFVTTWFTEPSVGPAGIGVDKNGNVYVANHRTHAHYVQKFE
jgi:DNA-binding beta-propeller fold protein YncE